jgi:hypothetical protein
MIRFFYAGFGLDDWKGAIFRGMDSHTYRFNIFPFEGSRNPPPWGKVAGEIRLVWTPDGRLTEGTWQMLPLCSQGQELGCTSLLFGAQAALITPVFGGVEQYDNNDTYLTGIYVTADGPGPAITVNIEKMLSQTTWNALDF